MIITDRCDCPTCGSENATLTHYYHCCDSETGYYDAGTILKCPDCGEELQDEEIDRAFAALEAE